MTGFDFVVWQPRKNKSYRKISDTWGFVQLNGKNGVSFDMDYSLKTDYTTQKTILRLAIYCRKPSTEADFYNLFGTSPLSYSGVRIEGGYGYENIFAFCDAETDAAVHAISEIVCKAVKEIEIYLDE